MKHLFPSLLLAAGLAGSLIAANPAPAPAKDGYPLTTCVVSDEKLGEMGKPYEYLHQEPGKAPRKVLFCCEGCSDDFKKDPAKFLKKLDDAAKVAAKKKS